MNTRTHLLRTHFEDEAKGNLEMAIVKFYCLHNTELQYITAIKTIDKLENNLNLTNIVPFQKCNKNQQIIIVVIAL